ncbi:MAG: PAS domain-containing protein [Rhodospirillaceae bacterium]|jgi:hypothetical protein|nr:PAS domain-containing protein [Rhodospirillaceae bacterium]MBT6136996.1 PAS domain-containing protein [Rhodospirillaceae bacterium]
MSEPVDNKLDLLQQHWLALKGESPLPLSSDIRPENFFYLLGRVSIIDVRNGDYILRLVGSGIEELYGMRMQGRLLNDLPVVKMSEDARDQLNEAASSRRPTRTQTQISHGTSVAYYHRLVLPFADKDGPSDKAAVLLTALDWLPDDEYLLSRYATGNAT